MLAVQALTFLLTLVPVLQPWRWHQSMKAAITMTGKTSVNQYLDSLSLAFPDSDGVYKLDTADANGATPWLAWIGNNSCSNPWTLSSDKYASPGSDLGKLSTIDNVIVSVFKYHYILGWAFLSGDNAMCPEDLTMMETLDTTLVISATDTAPTITCKNSNNP